MRADFEVRRWHWVCAAGFLLFVAGMGAWRWADRPLLVLRCPGGQRPELANIFVSVSGGTLRPNFLTLSFWPRELRVYQQRTLTVLQLSGEQEREEMFHRLERPPSAPAAVGGPSSASVRVSLTCDGVITQIADFSENMGDPALTAGWRSRPEELLGALKNELHDRDPRLRKVYATALEVVAITQPKK